MYRFWWIWQREPLILKPIAVKEREICGILQACYGYVSFGTAFIDAAAAVNSGELTLDRCDRDLLRPRP